MGLSIGLSLNQLIFRSIFWRFITREYVDVPYRNIFTELILAATIKKQIKAKQRWSRPLPRSSDFERLCE